MKVNKSECNQWNKQPKESPQAFQAFRLYLDLGLERTQGQVARQLEKSFQLISKWSTRNDWRRRAEAWNIHEDEIRRARYSKERIEHRESCLRIGKLLQSKALEGLIALKPVRTITNAEREVERVPNLKVGEITALLQSGARHVETAIGDADKAEPSNHEVIFYIDDGKDGPKRLDSNAAAEEEELPDSSSSELLQIRDSKGFRRAPKKF